MLKISWLPICYCFSMNCGFFYELNVLIKNISLIPYKNFIPIYPYLISEGRRNCSILWPARNRDSQETSFQIKTHAKMDGLILSKSRDIKIAPVNSTRITTCISQSTLFSWCHYISVTSARGLARLLMSSPVNILYTPVLSFSRAGLVQND